MSHSTFIQIVLLITYAIAMFYYGQEIETNRVKAGIEATLTKATTALQAGKQAEINDFIRRNQ